MIDIRPILVIVAIIMLGINPNDMFDISPILIFIVIMLGITLLTLQRSQKSIALRKSKFWELASTRQKPVILIATNGFIFKRLCYVFPYEGIFFYTDAANTEVPDGVTLIRADDSFSLS